MGEIMDNLDNLVELFKLAYLQSPSEAEYYLNKYIKDLNNIRGILEDESVHYDVGNDDTQSYLFIVNLKNKIKQYDLQISKIMLLLTHLRSGGR